MLVLFSRLDSSEDNYLVRVLPGKILGFYVYPEETGSAKYVQMGCAYRAGSSLDGQWACRARHTDT
eukprot:9052799-Pyramimonas_sp.AAC.3